MKNLDELPEILDEMISRQKEKKARTFVAKYKGKTLITRSGKSSWKAKNHAKSAIICHFQLKEDAYAYPNELGGDRWKGSKERIKEFRARLFELIEIVELED